MKKKRSQNFGLKSNSGNGPIVTESAGSGSNVGSVINSNRQSTPPSSQSLTPNTSAPIQSSANRLGSNNNSILEEQADGHEQQTDESILSPQDHSDSSSRDDLDALLPPNSSGNKIKIFIDHYQAKINKTKEAIKAEQTTRDENVNEYLKLAANADKAQIQRIKSIFEKKNKKSAHNIAQLQKKLENYGKKIRALETYGIQRLHRHRSKAMLSNVGQGLKGVGNNIKEGISGLSEGVIGSIKMGFSSATHYSDNVSAKNKDTPKSKIESIDNINSGDNSASESITEAEAESIKPHNQGGSIFYTHSQTHSQSTKHTSEEESSSITSESGQLGGFISASSTGKPGFGFFNSHSLVNQIAPDQTIHDLNSLTAYLRERRDDYQRLLEELEAMRTQFQAEISLINQSLQEERYKSERLEEQLNDLIELHQNEIENLKQNIADMEEKVQYQSEERSRDIYEMLESCQTRISRMEHQHHQHLQQLVNLNSLENSNARALVLKLINVLLTILQVVLLLVATVANIVAPFLKTRVRIFITLILLIFLIFARQKSELTIWFKSRFGDRFPLIITLLSDENEENG